MLGVGAVAALPSGAVLELGTAGAAPLGPDGLLGDAGLEGGAGLVGVEQAFKPRPKTTIAASAAIIFKGGGGVCMPAC
jgi:hypothetical protein